MKKGFRNGIHPLELAGWLFADLLLVLAVVGLASQVPIEAKAEPVPTHAVILDPALNLKPVEVTFTVNLSGVLSNNFGAISQLKSAFKSSHFNSLQSSGKEAGFVMIFSGATTSSSSCNGSVSSSQKVFKILSEVLPRLIRSTTVHKPFIRTSCAERNTVRIEVYTFR